MKKVFILFLPALMSLALSAQNPTSSNAFGKAESEDPSHSISACEAESVRLTPIFYEDFESGNTFPSGWCHYHAFMSDVLNGSASLVQESSLGNPWQLDDLGKEIGFGLPSKHMFMNVMGSVGRNWVVSPEFSISNDSYLSFDLSLNYSNSSNSNWQRYPYLPDLDGVDDKFAVLIKVGEANWTQLALWDNQGADRIYNAIDQYPQTIVLPIAVDQNTTVRLAFYGESTVINAVNAIQIDNIGVWPNSSIVPPDGIVVSNKTSNGAQISWDAEEGVSSYSLRYKKVTDASWTAIDNLTSTSCTLSDLVPETYYKVKIKAFGQGQAESWWSNEVVFRTAPNYESYSIPFSETFNSNQIPENWVKRSDVANYVLAYGGCHPKMSFYDVNEWNCGNVAQSFKRFHAKAVCYGKNTGWWLVTPNIDLSSASNPDDLCLVFDVAITAHNSADAPQSPLPDDDDEFRVLISSDAGETWTSDHCYTWKKSGGDFDICDIPVGLGTTVRLPLSDFAGGSVMIAFYCGSGAQLSYIAYSFDIHVDNIFVGEASHVFVAEGDWNDASCWISQSVPNDLGDNVLVKANVAIPAGYTAQANDIAFYTKTSYNYALQLNEFTPTLTIIEGGQLKHNSEGVKATVQKNIQAYTSQNDKWYLLASPIVETILPAFGDALLANNYDLYMFDQSVTDGLEWRNYDACFFNIDHKTGYLYANNENVMLEFVGTLAANTEATPLAYDENANWKGFNLIGNPYPCNAYVDRSFYVLDENGVQFIPGSGAIPPCSAILVEAQGEGESVSFSKTPIMKKGLAVSVMKADDRANSCLDKACVSFEQNDVLTKYSPNADGSSLYIPQGGRDLAVASAYGQDELPINFKANENGKYSLNIEVENMDLDYLHLIDNLTGVETDLLQQPTYSFEAKTTDYSSRFRLVFSADESEMASEEKNFAFFTNGQLFIPFVEDEAQLQIVDMTGRILCNEHFSGSYTKQLQLPAGVYVMQLVSNNQQKTQKIVVE